MTTYRTIPLSRLVMPARPLRGRIDAEGVDELAASIREIGQLDPILVRPLPDARLATTEKRASVVALSLAETKSAGADVIVADAEARRVTAEQRAVEAEAQAERLEREIADAEVRGALAVFRAVVRAEEEGHVVPVPLDERVWPSVAAEICAQARAKGGE